MAYKLAIASSDETNIDESFGSATRFHIFEIEGRTYRKVEDRSVGDGVEELQSHVSSGCNQNACQSKKAEGCTGTSINSKKVELIADCRCVVCQKIGFHIQKQLERKAISTFDVSCAVTDALEQISFYYDRVDRHQSLRGVADYR